MNNIDYLESLSNHNIICKECCTTPTSLPSSTHLVNINISILHSSPPYPALLSIPQTVSGSLSCHRPQERRSGDQRGLRPRTVIRWSVSLSPPLGYTWSAEECHSTIIREKFQQFGSAGSQEFSALVKSHVFIRKKGMWRTYQHLSLAGQKPAQGNT